MALVVPTQLPGSVRLDATTASLRTLVPGRRILVFYEGADDVWHEQIAAWPVTEDGSWWVICSCDRDIYPQDMAGGTMISHLVVLDDHGTRPVGLGAPIYGFRRGPSETEMVGVIRRGRVSAIAHLAPGSPIPTPSHVLLWNGRRVTTIGVGLDPDLPRTHRIGAKRTPGAPAAPTGDGFQLPALPEAVPARMSDGRAPERVGPAERVGASGVWVCLENAGGLRIGDPVVPGHNFETIGGDRAIARVDGDDGRLVHVCCRRVADSEDERGAATRALLADMKDALAELGGAATPRGEAAEASANSGGDEAAARLAGALQGSSDDVRTLEVTYDFQEAKYKDFRIAVQELVEDSMWDWPLDEPRTVMWVLKTIARSSHSMTSWLDSYFQRKPYAASDRSRHELRAIAETVQYLVTYDQVNCASLAGVERLMRRWQLIIQAHDRDPLKPHYDEDQLYSGQGEEAAGVCPALSRTVAHKIKDKNEIERHRRGHPGDAPKDPQPPKDPKGKAAGKGAADT